MPTDRKSFAEPISNEYDRGNWRIPRSFSWFLFLRSAARSAVALRRLLTSPLLLYVRYRSQARPLAGHLDKVACTALYPDNNSRTVILPYSFLKLTFASVLFAWLASAADTLTPPAPQKVVVVILENHDYQQIVGDTTNAPFLNSVISQGLLFTNAHGVDHPSQPNYLALFSGSDQGVNSRNSSPTNTLNLNFLLAYLKAALADPKTPPAQIPILQGQLAQVQGALAAGIDPSALTGDAFPSPANFSSLDGNQVRLPFNSPNLGSVLMKAGKTFTEYVEGLSEAGAADKYGYAVVDKVNNPADPYSVGYAHRHDPASNWISNVPSGNQLPRYMVQDFSNFPAESNDFSFLPNVSLIVPNTINDMHDGTVPFSTRTGDLWCKNNLGNYLAWAKTHNSILIITTDEADTDPANHIMTLVAGDPNLVQAGTSDQYLTHFDLLRSVESMFSTEYAGFSSEVYGAVFLNGRIVASSPAPTLRTPTQTLSGTTNSGALYQIIVPKPWNGQLLMYAHGYTDISAPVAIPNSVSELQIYDAFTSQGFAVAISSYARNGWAVKEGLQDIRDLQTVFSAQVGKPVRSYLVGVSMGGLITVDLAENAGKFDGALSICGVVAGAPANYQRFGDGRVVFDYFFPRVLPGDLLSQPNLDFSPGSPTFNLIAGTLSAGFAAPGNPTLQFASVTGLTGSSINELIFSAVSLLAGSNFNELLTRTGGLNFYDNTNTVYTGSNNDKALNAAVRRYQSNPDAVNYLRTYYQPTGKLTIPLVTLHTTEDPTVPFSQEATYLSVVTKADASNLLVQQSALRYGHCNVNPAEILTSFQGLYGWVNLGIRPAGGDITVP